MVIKALKMLQPLVDLLKHNITPLPLITDPSFSSNFHKLLSSKSSPRIVLIGDASHGTHEFYAARAQLTQHLISKHGFNCVAVEADFPDAECIDRYVRRRYGHTTSLAVNEPKTEAFQRFPRWMWRNVEVHDFVAWLREHNKGKHAKSPESVGFYGLDLYSMGASMQAVIQYLEHVDPKMAAMARKRYGALQPWVEHPQEYGLAALTGSFKDCERDVLRMLKELLERRIEYSSHAEDGDEFHGSEQNARVVAGMYQFLSSSLS
jgi:erythromycin esterase-like protein